MKIILETNRLILRPFELTDANDMYNNWASDEEVTKYMTWNPHRTIDQTKEIISNWIKLYEKPERISFAITLKETCELIGSIDVVGYLEGVPVIGYALTRKHWNKGYMTEACKKVIEFIFSLGHNSIKIDAVVENIGSNKVIQKCGGEYLDTIDEYFENKKQTFSINRYIIKNSKLID